MFQDDAGAYTGYCFACSTFIPNPYADRPVGYKPAVIKKSKEQIEAEIQDISTYQTVDLPLRKLRKESLSYFGVKIGVSEIDGITPVTHYYPYYKDGELRGYKVRLIENKKFWAVGDTKDVDFFGWEQAISVGAKKLFICEGELDAVALYQIFKDSNKGTQYADYNPAIISLTSGASSAPREISKHLANIRKHFKEIILVFDTDIPGKNAAEEVVKIVPDALIAHLPAKDVNECLLQGRSKAVYNATQFNASKPKNTRFVSGDDLHDSAKQQAEFGYSWPWKHITQATRGIRLGETIYVGAGQKQG